MVLDIDCAPIVSMGAGGSKRAGGNTSALSAFQWTAVLMCILYEGIISCPAWQRGCPCLLKAMPSGE
jgi:hypothetical protein